MLIPLRIRGGAQAEPPVMPSALPERLPPVHVLPEPQAAQNGFDGIVMEPLKRPPGLFVRVRNVLPDGCA